MLNYVIETRSFSKVITTTTATAYLTGSEVIKAKTLISKQEKFTESRVEISWFTMMIKVE